VTFRTCFYGTIVDQHGTSAKKREGTGENLHAKARRSKDASLLSPDARSIVLATQADQSRLTGSSVSVPARFSGLVFAAGEFDSPAVLGEKVAQAG
jgi:hypothetical protein